MQKQILITHQRAIGQSLRMSEINPKLLIVFYIQRIMIFMDVIRKRIFFLLITLGLVFILALSTLFIRQLSLSKQLVIGAKDPEGQLVAEMITQMLEANTQVKVIQKSSFDGTFITFNALKMCYQYLFLH